MVQRICLQLHGLNGVMMHLKNISAMLYIYTDLFESS